MSLELDFLAALAKQPDMESKTSTIARQLHWEEGFPRMSYATDLANLVSKRLEMRGLVERWQDGPSGHIHVRLVRP